MVEIVFQIEDEETKEKLSRLGVDPDEGQIVISRRITGSRSVNRINGENVSVSVIRQVAALCIDIHGQHENQSLLQKDKHLAIVDEFATKPVSYTHLESNRCKSRYGDGNRYDDRWWIFCILFDYDSAKTERK